MTTIRNIQRLQELSICLITWAACRRLDTFRIIETQTRNIKKNIRKKSDRSWEKEAVGAFFDIAVKCRRHAWLHHFIMCMCA